MGVLEPKPKIFKGKNVIVPYALTRGASPEEIVVANCQHDRRGEMYRGRRGVSGNSQSMRGLRGRQGAEDKK